MYGPRVRLCAFVCLTGGLFVAQEGCKEPGEDQPFVCLTDQDCPPRCVCSDPFINRCSNSREERCGGTCDRVTACPEGTACEFDRVIRNTAIYECRGAGGMGGTGGSFGGCPVVSAGDRSIPFTGSCDDDADCASNHCCMSGQPADGCGQRQDGIAPNACSCRLTLRRGACQEAVIGNGDPGTVCFSDDQCSSDLCDTLECACSVL